MAFKITANEPGLMKMHIISTIFCFYLACDLYTEIDFGVHMIRTYKMQSMLKVEKNKWPYSTPLPQDK